MVCIFYIFIDFFCLDGIFFVVKEPFCKSFSHFQKSCSICGCSFNVFVGGDKFKVFLFCYLDPTSHCSFLENKALAFCSIRQLLYSIMLAFLGVLPSPLIAIRPKIKVKSQHYLGLLGYKSEYKYMNFHSWLIYWQEPR